MWYVYFPRTLQIVSFKGQSDSSKRMSWLYGIHATRSEFANSIRSNGLRPGGGKGLWIGKAAYLAIVSNVADLEAATDYGGKFVQKADKPSETPHFFLFRMRASKCICLQNKTTTAELRKFGAAFDAKAKQLGFELPANQVNSDLPLSLWEKSHHP